MDDDTEASSRALMKTTTATSTPMDFSDSDSAQDRNAKMVTNNNNFEAIGKPRGIAAEFLNQQQSQSLDFSDRVGLECR